MASACRELDATTTGEVKLARDPKYRMVQPGDFEPEEHCYPRVLNAQIHALVRYFLNLSNERIVARYCHLNPRVDPDALREILRLVPKHFRWAGSDLLYVTTATGVRRMVVIETNSCPSGQESMPLYDDNEEQGGYRVNLQRSFVPRLKKRGRPEGELAVIKVPYANAGQGVYTITSNTDTTLGCDNFAIARASAIKRAIPSAPSALRRSSLLATSRWSFGS